MIIRDDVYFIITPYKRCILLSLFIIRSYDYKNINDVHIIQFFIVKWYFNETSMFITSGYE